jgi:alpha/beta superfamily hydrolase
MTTAFNPIQPDSSSESARLRSVDLTGPAGRLEAILNLGAQDAPFAALVCHPNPKAGGTMHNKVVYHAMKVLNDAEWGLGWPVLRFNFRGTGLSEGSFDGRAEAEDVLAALGWLVNAYKNPIVVAGFSFGSAMALMACCQQPAAIHAVAALGLPTTADGHQYHYRFLADCNIPKLFLSGDDDVFAPVTQLTQVFDSAAEPKHMVLVPGADHFFTGKLELMQKALAGWLKEPTQ